MLASKVIAQAQAWLGKKESDGSHKSIVDIYNSIKPLPRGYKVKYTDSWCATFVSAVAIACGYAYDFPIECSCQRMITLASNMGIWNEDDAHTPKPADIILYNWDDNGKGNNTGWADHVGIVESVSNGVIKVIEGNINNQVGYREIAVNGKGIRGYICPKYETEKKAEPAVITLDEVVRKVCNGEYGNGAERKKRIPAETPFTYEEVQEAVNAFMTAEKYTPAPPKVEYYPRYSGTSNSLVDALKSLKIDSSKAHRTIIAEKNGISGYAGKASENTKLLNLLKAGNLIKE